MHLPRIPCVHNMATCIRFCGARRITSISHRFTDVTHSTCSANAQFGFNYCDLIRRQFSFVCNRSRRLNSAPHPCRTGRQSHRKHSWCSTPTVNTRNTCLTLPGKHRNNLVHTGCGLQLSHSLLSRSSFARFTCASAFDSHQTRCSRWTGSSGSNPSKPGDSNDSASAGADDPGDDAGDDGKSDGSDGEDDDGVLEHTGEVPEMPSIHSPGIMPLSPMTVPEVWPQVPVIAVKRNPVFPRFIKMIEVSFMLHICMPTYHLK